MRRKGTLANSRLFEQRLATRRGYTGPYRSARKKFRRFARKNTRSFPRLRRGRISGVKAHKFIDRSQQCAFYVISGGYWNVLLSPTIARNISPSSTGDYFLYFRPNISQSSLFTGLASSFTHVFFSKWVINIKANSSGNTNPAAGVQQTTTSYNLFCKDYPWNNIPQTTPTTLAPNLTTYAQCLDDPSFFKMRQTKSFNLTMYPWAWNCIQTSFNAISYNTLPVKYKIKSKSNVNDVANIYYHGCLMVMEQISSSVQQYSLENSFHFTLYNPY